MTALNPVVLLSLLANIITFAAVVLGLLRSYRNGLAIGEATDKLSELNIRINGRMEKLLALAETSGQLVGRAEARREQLEDQQLAKATVGAAAIPGQHDPGSDVSPNSIRSVTLSVTTALTPDEKEFP